MIDPAAGRGELLAAAAEQLVKAGGKPRGLVTGVELHERTARGLRKRLSAYASAQQLLHGDFFLMTETLPKCDAVIANPPYVRHQQIPARDVTRMRVALNGRAHIVGGKASAWAYFLAYAPALLKPHGRLAFVLPGDVLTSDYSVPILDYLASNFKAVKFVYCDGVVFRDLSQRTVLCLADDYHAGSKAHKKMLWARVQVDNAAPKPGGPPLNRAGYTPVRKGVSLSRLLASADVFKLEQALKDLSGIKRLGDLASVGIGYVTGSNRFFHLSEVQHRQTGIHARHLKRIVPRSGAFSGIAYTLKDWECLRGTGGPCWLLNPRDRKDDVVRRVLKKGLRAKVHETSKSRNRALWWKVPTKPAAPAFMSYMGASIRVVSNRAAVLVPNSLYELRDLKGVSAKDLAIASLTSVFQLSARLNARLLGGGLKKLEPSDAADTLVPIARLSKTTATKIDRLVRSGRLDEARKAADRDVLVDSLGMSIETVRRIDRALSALNVS